MSHGHPAHNGPTTARRTGYPLYLCLDTNVLDLLARLHSDFHVAANVLAATVHLRAPRRLSVAHDRFMRSPRDAEEIYIYRGGRSEGGSEERLHARPAGGSGTPAAQQRRVVGQLQRQPGAT